MGREDVSRGLIRLKNELNLEISIAKTNALLFTRHRDLLQPIPFFSSVITFQKSVKILGIILDSKLSWCEHVNAFAARAQTGLNAMRAIRST